MSSYLSDWRLFIKQYLRQPLKVAAIKPSSAALGRKMAKQIPDPEKDYVLELGPGTGPLTQQILKAGVAPGRLYMVERNPELHDYVSRKFPGVHSILGDADHLDQILPQDKIGAFSAVVSGLPLLTFKRDLARSIVQQSFAVLKPGGVFIQFSYGFVPPFRPEHLNLDVRRVGWVWENFPPAGVWVYTAKQSTQI